MATYILFYNYETEEDLILTVKQYNRTTANGKVIAESENIEYLQYLKDDRDGYFD